MHYYYDETTNRCYGYRHLFVNWDQAREICLEEGADLVSIDGEVQDRQMAGLQLNSIRDIALGRVLRYVPNNLRYTVPHMNS